MQECLGTRAARTLEFKPTLQVVDSLLLSTRIPPLPSMLDLRALEIPVMVRAPSNLPSITQMSVQTSAHKP